MPPSIVWFRQDLRLDDHPALCAAVARGGPVIPVYVWAPEEEGRWAPAGASRWWLHHSLASLDGSLRSRGSRLVLRRGGSLESLEAVAREAGATSLFWSRRTEPCAVARDREVARRLRERGWEAETLDGEELFPPERVRSRSGGPFRIFTPFWNACLKLPQPAAPERAPRRLPAPERWPDSEALVSLDLEPKPGLADGFRKIWRPGEEGAAENLRRFLRGPAAAYATDRDRPDRPGTSRLSPHLHFGEMGPRRIWHALQDQQARNGARGTSRGVEGLQRQLGWREFARHLLFHFPHTADHPLRSEFARFPWSRNGSDLEAWRKGMTGYPLVDAGMRELRSTGWMHNRVRMVVASFLVKDLRLSWLEGATWFWDALVDADLANNTLGWQWAAGCGADAAPYFRIFNPVTQGERFDPQGGYVRRWVPELSKLPDEWIHRPFEAPAPILAAAGVVLGKSYPAPRVDHDEARERALEALATLRKAK